MNLQRLFPSVEKLWKSAHYFGLIFFSVGTAILVDLSKDPEGGYLYNPFSVPLIVDIVKIFFSLTALCITTGLGSPLQTYMLRDHILFAIPAACYFVCNICVLFIIARVGVVQYQILSNMKILFSAFAMRIFLGRVLRLKQWFALFLLFGGLLLAEWPGNKHFHTDAHMTSGHGLIILTSVMSSIGGVFSEKLLKSRLGGDNLHWKNIQLYSWGLAFGLIAFFTMGREYESFFAGYNFVVVAMILLMAFSGLIVSVILKYSDSLSKAFVSSLSIVITTCVQVFRHVEQLSPRLCLSVITIYYALQLYESC